MQNKKIGKASLSTAILFLVAALSGCLSLPDPASLQAYFNFTPSDPMVGDEVYFTAYADESFGIASWAWNFGDEEALERGLYRVGSGCSEDCLFDLNSPCVPGNHLATVQNPIHVFCEPGVYTVTLSVYNLTGSEIVRQKEISVTDFNFMTDSGTVSDISYEGESVSIDFTWNPEMPEQGESISFEERVVSTHEIVEYSWRLVSGVGNDTGVQESYEANPEFPPGCYDPPNLGRDIECAVTLTVKTGSGMPYSLTRTICLSEQETNPSGC